MYSYIKDMKNIKHYFAGANTGIGFSNFFDNILDKEKDGYEYVIKGGPGTGKSTFMRKIGEYFSKKGEPIEYFYCSSDFDSLDGVRLPNRNICMVDGTAPHVIEANVPAVSDKIINVGAFISDDIAKDKAEITKLIADTKTLFDTAYAYITIASTAQKLAINLSQDKNFDAVSAATEYLLTEKIGTSTNPGLRRLYISTINENGLFCIAGKNNYKKLIKVVGSESDSAKTMDELKVLLLKHGHEITVSQNPLFGEILDFIEIPKLQTLFMRSPDKPKGENQDSLAFCNQTIKTYTDKAGEYLYKAKQTHRKLEEFYVKNVDFDKLNEFSKKIIAEIESKIK